MIIKNSCDAFYLVLKQLLGNSTCLYFILAHCEITFQGVMEELKLVGNTAKGRISKWVFRENRVRQTFKKNEHFLPPDMHTYVCVSGSKKCSFFGKCDVLCFLEIPVLRFALFALLSTSQLTVSLGIYRVYCT